MADYQHIEPTRTDGIATVQITRHEARNALNATLMAELTDVATQLRRDKALQAVVLYGSDRFFSAGADLSMVQDVIDAPSDQDVMAIRELLRAGPDMCDAWAAIEVPTIAAIEGYCVGGGVALAVSCDFRIVGSSTVMKLPEVPYGMNMSWHTLPRLVALMGPAKAKQMTLFGEPVDAQTLAAWGAVDVIVEVGEGLDKAKAWAAKFENLPPLAVRMTLESIDAVATAGHRAATFSDRDQFLLTLMSGAIKTD